jgi:hypothetical protein
LSHELAAAAEQAENQANRKAQPFQLDRFISFPSKNVMDYIHLQLEDKD